MNLWIINHYALTPEMSGGTRHYDLAKALVQRGHRVRIIASSFHYATLKEMKSYGEAPYLHEQIDGIDFTWIKTRPYRGNTLGRVVNMLDFSWKSWRLLASESPPDVILGSSVHLFAVYSAYRLGKRMKRPFVMEVRDIWPQTLVDMGVSRWHPFVLLLGWLERLLYQKAAQIITLLPRAEEHICRFGIPKSQITWISNGVDLAPFQAPKPTALLDGDTFNVVYAGTLGKANNLEVFIEAAKLLGEYPKIQIILVGSGPEQEALKSKVKAWDNVTILPPIPKADIPGLLTSADLLYVGLKALPLYRFGMSMNKVFDYMAAAKPVVFASGVVENPVAKAQSGVVVPSDDARMIAEAIVSLYNMPFKAREAMGRRGYDYVATHHAIPVMADRFEYLIKKVVDESPQ